MSTEFVNTSLHHQSWSPEQKAQWLISLYERKDGGIQRVHAELMRWNLSSEEFSRVQAHVLCTALERDYSLSVVEEFAELFRSLGSFLKEKDDTSTRLKAICEMPDPEQEAPSPAQPKAPFKTTQVGWTRPAAPKRATSAAIAGKTAHVRPTASSIPQNRGAKATATHTKEFIKKHSSDRLYRQMMAEKNGGGGGGRILIVDSDRYGREALCAWLRADYEVTTVNDGMAALRQMMNRQFSLVIMDMQAPGKYDLEVIEKLARMKTRVPIILCTGRSDVTRYKQIRTYGPIRTCPKPVNGQAVARHVAEMLAVSA